MAFINIKELNKLVASIDSEDRLQATAKLLLKKYHLKVHFQDLLGLVEGASRINQREKNKTGKFKSVSKVTSYQIFSFGEFKIFNWVLVLLCHLHKITLSEMTSIDFEFIRSIFKTKSEVFIRYQIMDLVQGKNKHLKPWDQEELKIFQEIIRQVGIKQEWKAVSFELFRRSGCQYFRTFQSCREKWISHLNPNIRKTEWSAKQDVELFTLILQYGCRWALISRELKGIRSEHTVKNRYNSLVKTVKKQYRLGDTAELHKKILKYLKIKEDKEMERQDRLNLSNQSEDSVDSISSRERSREECRENINLSQESVQQSEVTIKGNNLFGDFCNAPKQTNESKEKVQKKEQYEHFLEKIKEEYKGLKSEKKTNDKDYEEQESQHISKMVDEDEYNREGKPLILDELEDEYNRFMNFDSPSKLVNDCFEDEIQEIACPIPDQWIENNGFDNWLQLNQ